MKIAIYSDIGASQEATNVLSKRLKELKLSFSYLTSKDIKAGKLFSFSLLIFPGGRDTPYHSQLQGLGTKEILRFVEEGGNYLGICAGAYFACAELEFDSGFPLEVTGKRELRFFPGKAIGPAYGKNTFSYECGKGSRAAKLLLSSSHSVYCFFKGGCIFENAEEKNGVHFLALYDDLEEKPPAILECKVGKGKAILSGVHFEYTGSDLNPLGAYEKEIIPKLKETEERRAEFFEEVLKRLT